MPKKIKQFTKWYGYYGLILLLKSKILFSSSETKVKPSSASLPFIIRTKTSDIPTYSQIFIKYDYNIKLCKEPKFIIDCGSNIGLSTIYFANKYPKTKIIAIEPEKTNFSLSLKNFKNYPNIIPIQAAIWKDNVKLDLIDPGTGNWGFQTEESNKYNFNSVIGNVTGITIDKIMKDYKIKFIDILKIDIEGAEKEVLENASKWIDKVGVIIIEIHDHFKKGCSQSLYNAVSKFDFKKQKGENIFFAKKEYVVNKKQNFCGGWIPQIIQLNFL